MSTSCGWGAASSVKASLPFPLSPATAGFGNDGTGAFHLSQDVDDFKLSRWGDFDLSSGCREWSAEADGAVEGPASSSFTSFILWLGLGLLIPAGVCIVCTVALLDRRLRRPICLPPRSPSSWRDSDCSDNEVWVPSRLAVEG